MKMHLDDGQLRASLDGELDARAQAHLESCAECRARQSRLQVQASAAQRKLAFLMPAGGEAAPSVRSAMSHFRDRKLTQKEIPVLKKIFASSLVRYAAIGALLLTLILAIPATRALADQVLNLFRVQQVAVIPVDFTGLQNLTGDGALGRQVSQLVSNSITMTKKPGDPVDVKDAAEASQKAGFTVRLPQDKVASRLSVENEVAFTFTIDRTKAQAVLDEAGRKDLVLPTDIDGAEVSVTVPASVMADYGVCPDPKSAESDGSGSPGRKYAGCVILSEIPSPTVDAPANVDVAQLAQLGLEFTGMTPEQAKAFTDNVDWTSTLVVPIPKNAATYEQVQVDGVTGTLIERPSDDAPQFVLLWVKDGIVYSIGGLGSNSQQAIDMANSLH
jgi:hypothetical protein